MDAAIRDGRALAAGTETETMTRQFNHLAVVFADVCGSTKLYGTLGDERARTVVDAALAIVKDILPEYDGRLVKTLGDEVMCVFTDPNRAVRAAALMQSRISACEPGGHRLALHIGLHYGPVLVDAADVFGDTVNAASYLCAVASAGQVLITDPTVASLSPSVRETIRPLFHAVVKGSTDESMVYQVLWQADTTLITHVNMRRQNLMPQLR